MEQEATAPSYAEGISLGLPFYTDCIIIIRRNKGTRHGNQESRIQPEGG